MRTITTLTLTGALALAGCGGGGGGDDKPAKKKATPRFTSAQVAQTFKDATGDRLVSSASDTPTSAAYFTALRLDDTGTPSYGRYGTFSVYVLGPRATKTIYAQDPETKRPIKPTAEGVYWSRTGDSYTAAKPYRNVVLNFTTDKMVLDARFKRLDAIIQAIGKRPGSVKLAPEDTPCAKAGIDIAAGDTGTCKQGEQTLVVVGRGEPLRVGKLTISKVRARTGRGIVSTRFGFTKRVRAKGRFVAVSFRYVNRSNKALSYFRGALAIGERIYTQDDRNAFYVQDPDAFPIQPGDSSTVTVLFDVPADAARDATTKGALAVNGDDDAIGGPDDATIQGRVLLGGGSDVKLSGRGKLS